ncbi:MAG: ATP-binding cassette domain-containing protein [Candidatus Heimdallarchaeota archaeon]
MTKSAISFENYSFRYSLRDRWTVKDINATISKGEFVILTGPSGSGKSTLCYSMLGLIPNFYAGEIEGKIIFHHDGMKKSSISKLSKNIGYIPQRIENSFTTPYVISELAFPMEYRNYSKQKMMKTIDTISSDIGIEHLLYRRINKLSDGEKQQIAIGCALVTDPEIIVADEPLANLDKKNKKTNLSILQKLHSEGKTIIVSTHELKNYANMVTRVIELSDGKIVRDISSIRKDNKEKTKKNFTLYNLKNTKESESFKEKVVNIENLSYEYTDYFQLSDISISLYKGEIIGLIGENGSGKTTMIKLLCGLLKPKKGKIRVMGNEIDVRNWREIAQNFGVVFQDPEKQFFEENLFDEIALISKNLGITPSIQVIKEILKESGLQDYEKHNAHSLSHGEKRRLAFLTAIYHDPPIIILDEITNGLGKQNKEWLINQLDELRRKGKSIFIASHDWEWLSHFADRVVLLEEGVISSIMNAKQFNDFVTSESPNEN